jgi:tetratricopeptide (TPR) repeat protein
MSLCVVNAQQPPQDTAKRYYELGERAVADNRLNDAAEAFRRLTQLDPSLAEAHAKLGLVYYQQGNFEGAIPEFRSALKLKPGLPNAGVLLALCLSETGRYAEAAPALEKAFRNPPSESTKRLIGLELLRSYEGMHRFDSAVPVAVELSRSYPDDPETLYSTGRFFGNISFLKMQRLLQVSADSVWTHQARGEAEESLERYALAISEYRKVLELDPDRPGIHLHIGRAILSDKKDAGSLAAALKEFEAELARDPSNASASYEIGEIYRNMGQLDKAQTYFQSAIKHYPNFEDAKIGLGRVLIDLQEPSRALPHLRDAVQLNAENEISHYLLARVYGALGKESERQLEIAQFRKLRDQKKAWQALLTKTSLQPAPVTKQILPSDAADLK